MLYLLIVIILRFGTILLLLLNLCNVRCLSEICGICREHSCIKCKMLAQFISAIADIQLSFSRRLFSIATPCVVWVIWVCYS